VKTNWACGQTKMIKPLKTGLILLKISARSRINNFIKVPLLAYNAFHAVLHERNSL
jgi:hypothetical protein